MSRPDPPPCHFATCAKCGAEIACGSDCYIDATPHYVGVKKQPSVLVCRDHGRRVYYLYRRFFTYWCSSACRQRAYRARNRHKECVCEVCGETFTSTRRDARFCSPRCRTQAYRARHVAPASTSPGRLSTSE